MKTAKGRPPGQPQQVPDLLGRRFGDLEVLAFIGVKDSRRWWVTRCLSTIRIGKECGELRRVETKTLNRDGGRRCTACNKHLLQQRAHQAGRWIYR